MERACSRQGRRGADLEEALSQRASWGSAPHERNRREGDHPIPFRTRKLSPSSPHVLGRMAVGVLGVRLMGGAFCVCAGGPGPGGTRPRPPFFCARAHARLLGGALAICGSHCGQSIALHAAIRRVCCAATTNLSISDKVAMFSSSIISFSIIEFLCFTMLFVRSFTFTCISTGRI